MPCALSFNSEGRNDFTSASRECQLEEGSATESGHDAIETPSIPMEEMLGALEQIHHQIEQPFEVIRFHSLQNKNKDVPVIPWKLELDMKNGKMHNHLQSLLGNSVWQLISLRIKMHHLAQSKMADDLMKMLKNK